MTWADLKAAWSGGWRAFADRALASYGTAAQADPAGTSSRVVAFVTALGTSRATLDRIRTLLPVPTTSDYDRQTIARYEELDRRWHDLAAGFYADATPTPTAPAAPSVGVAPALLVGGLAVTAVGVAWAIAAYEYAVNLQGQTELAERELAARVDASREGRLLPPSTLPPAPPNPLAASSSVGLWLLGGLAALAGALSIPVLLNRK